MDKKKQKNIAKFVFAAVILIVLIFLFYNPKIEISEELAICIDQKSELYVQEGCSACEVQEEMFGQYDHLLNSFDCKVNIIQCDLAGIRSTPTWIIGGKAYVGVQELNTLKRLTNC